MNAKLDIGDRLCNSRKKIRIRDLMVDTLCKFMENKGDRIHEWKKSGEEKLIRQLRIGSIPVSL